MFLLYRKYHWILQNTAATTCLCWRRHGLGLGHVWIANRNIDWAAKMRVSYVYSYGLLWGAAEVSLVGGLWLLGNGFNGMHWT